MKRFGLIGLLLLSFFMAPSFAGAQSWSDDFNDGVTDASLWTVISGGEHGDDIIASEQNGRLEYLADGWNDSELGYSGYTLKDSFSLDNDFQTSVDFHYSHEGAFIGDAGALQFALYNMGAGVDEPDYVFALMAGNVFAGGSNHDYFMRYSSTPLFGTEELPFERMVDDGAIHVRYLAAADRMEYLITDSLGAEIDSDGMDNFRATFDLDTLQLAFLGASAGAELVSGEAYIDNFSATATPEPVSVSLFLLGGGVLALRRRRKKA